MIVIEPGRPPLPEPKKSAPPPPGSLRVIITHEFGLPWVTLEYEDGKTEELEHVEALEWFRKRGAVDMDKVNQAINDAFNFYHSEVVIAKPVKPAEVPGEPKV
jgi:hypothetical protein